MYDTEHQLVDALPKLADAASIEELKKAFRMHPEETKGQIERLEKVLKSMEFEPKRETCVGMKGLVA
ncbi:MAG: DUF892 family protein [Spirochaetales bacterium]